MRESEERTPASARSTALASELAPGLRGVRAVDGGIAVEVCLALPLVRVLLLERFLELALHLLRRGGAFFGAHDLSLEHPVQRVTLSIAHPASSGPESVAGATDSGTGDRIAGDPSASIR